jgi:23S rRNA (uracil1939-C5)-methyltransferase
MSSYIIEDLNGFGDGVTRIDGKVAFVSAAVPGDKVSLKNLVDCGRYYKAEVDELHEAGESREMNISCPHFSEGCGGCQLLHVKRGSYSEMKSLCLNSQLRGILKESSPQLFCGSLEGFRNKAVFQLNREAKLCYKSEDMKDLPICDCLLLEPVIRSLLPQVQETLFSIPSSLRPQKLMFKSFSDGSASVVFLYLRLPSEKSMTSLVSALPSLKGVSFLACAYNKTGISSAEPKILKGQSSFAEEAGGIRYPWHPCSFFQTNREIMAKMYDQIRVLVEESGVESLLDLYCGMGTILLSLRDSILWGKGVESVPSAVKAGQAILSSHKLDHLQILEAKLPAGLSLSGYEKPEAWVVNPPRAGLGMRFFRDIPSSVFPMNIIYMSCNPKSFEKDAGMLCKMGYGLSFCKCYDMFPWTSHFEVLGMFSKAV